jgi:hypothetical protein
MPESILAAALALIFVFGLAVGILRLMGLDSTEAVAGPAFIDEDDPASETEQRAA